MATRITTSFHSWLTCHKGRGAGNKARQWVCNQARVALPCGALPYCSHLPPARCFGQRCSWACVPNHRCSLHAAEGASVPTHRCPHSSNHSGCEPSPPQARCSSPRCTAACHASWRRQRRRGRCAPPRSPCSTVAQVRQLPHRTQFCVAHPEPTTSCLLHASQLGFSE